MGRKVEELREEQLVFEALGNERRRRMLEVLHQMSRPSLDLHQEFPDCSWPAISRHLAILKRAGLLSSFEGELSCRPVYGVGEGGLRVAASWLEKRAGLPRSRF